MDKMREEFESWYLKQVDDDNVESIELWDAWKASRAALCVELPPTKDDVYQYNQALHDVAGVLQSSGVEYK